MRWEDERYIRLYTRDTAEFLALSFEAQGLLALIFRKVDRAGILDLGRLGKRGVAVAIGHAARWEPTIAASLEELLADGCVVVHGDKLVVRNFVQAQEATMSDKARAAAYRERLKAGMKARTDTDVTDRHATSPPVIATRPVTPPNGALPLVTKCDQNVTPSVPSKPSVPSGGGSADPETGRANLVAQVLRLRFPGIENPETIAKLWMQKFPGLDLPSEIEAAHVYALSSGKKYDAPGAFLLGWFKRAARGETNGNSNQTSAENGSGAPGVEATDAMLAKWRRRPTVPMPEHMRTKK